VIRRPVLRLVPPRGPAAEPVEASTLPLAPALELLALGAGITLTMAMLARMPSWFEDLGRFQALAAVAFGFFALAIVRRERYRAIPRAGAAVFAVALAARAALFPTPPTLSGDLYRYVWEGRVAAAGLDPYRSSPGDSRLARLRDRLWAPINHKQLSAIYPPLAIAGFAFVARFSPTVPAFKLWILLHDLALVAVLIAWTRRATGDAIGAIAYAWNPLVLIEYAGSGHNDPTALVWLALAFALARSRPTLSAIGLALGALVKLAPLIALPLLFARWPWRARIATLALLVPGLAFYWIETRASYSGLIAFWGTWRNNELLFHYLERWAGSFGVARTITIVIVGLAIGYALWRRGAPAIGARLAMRTATLVAPVFHPWYLGWTLLFEPLAPSAPWLLLSLTAFLNYGVLSTPIEGRSFHLPLPWRWFEYGIPLALAAALALRATATRPRRVAS
jgi:hypothetical protein